MNRLLRLASVRFYLRHPWQLVLAIAGISLGVGVYVGVDLASDSAARAFESSSAIVRGQATHRLLGSGGDIDEDVYREIVVERGVASAAPVVEYEVGIAGRPGERYPLLGIDPLQERGVRGFTGFVPGRGTDLARLMTEPGTVLLPSALAAELGVTAGAKLVLTVHGRESPVEIVGIVGDGSRDAQAEPPIVADIATAQELLGARHVLSRIDLKLSADQAKELASNLPRGAVLVPADAGNEAFEELATGFRTNLTALGLLALVVGTFLIYGTMSFAIVQRRATLGVLRALGLTRREVLGSVLLEALVLGSIATMIGLVLGHLLATKLVDLVLRTIGDLYFSGVVKAAAPSLSTYVRGGALGIAGTLLAGAKPALDAARAAPAAVLHRATLERGARRDARIAAWIALPLIALSLSVLAWGPHDLYTAFGGLFGMLAAGALLVPAATVLFAHAVEWCSRPFLSLAGVLAIRGVRASLSRTGVATAALAIAIATVNGVGLMISSFRTSLADWLGTTLTADIYVAFDADGATPTLRELSAVERIDGVRGLSLTRTVSVIGPLGEFAVRAVLPGPDGWGLELVGGDPGTAFAALANGAGTFVSERFAFARDLRIGDQLSVPTPSGEQRLPIVGTFRDFNTGAYSIVVALDWFRRQWHDSNLTGIGVYLERRAAPADVEADLRATLRTPMRVRSTEAIQRVSLQIFDRTFQITEVLRVLAAIVAFLGVLSALLSIELERSRELAVLRALGFTPRELTATLLAQTGMLGAAAGLAAVPIGTVLAALLVHVINRRSFGWSMDLVVTPEPLVAGIALAVTAAMLAGIYPALRSIRAQLGGALREE